VRWFGNKRYTKSFIKKGTEMSPFFMSTNLLLICHADMAKYTIEHIYAGIHGAIIPAKQVAKMGNPKRVVCSLGNETIHAAVQPTQSGDFYVHLSKPLLKKLRLKAGDQVAIQFQEDHTEHQFAMPEVLEEVLQTDPEAKAAFDAFTPGKRRSLIYLVQQVKSTNKQIERALLIAGRIKAGISDPRIILRKTL
jgi:hypothetical protein